MSPLNESQSSYTGQATDVTLKHEDVSSCKETTDSNGHFVKHAPPTFSTLKQGMSSSSNNLSDGQKPFHDKTRPHNSELPGIQIYSSELSKRFTPQSPELTSPAISQHMQLTMPSGRISEPYDKATQELKDKLLQLAGIPRSIYQRQYPNLALCDTIYGGDSSKLQQIRNTVEYIFSHYEIQKNIDFKNYLESKGWLKGIFEPESYMWNRPGSLLEIVVHYLFQDDPVLRNIYFTGAHGYGLSFPDHEILTVHQPVRSEFTSGVEETEQIKVKYTSNKRPIIQQQATRGCTYAAAAMLIHQHKRRFSVSTLKSTNLGDDTSIFHALSTAGLTPFKNRFANLEQLNHAINQDGPAIVSVITEEIGAHEVIVDAVTDTFVLIRDPYHGWEVEIIRSAFEKSWGKNAIQVK